MKGQLRIEKMFAFVLVDDDDTEGIPSVHGPGGMQVPLIGADPLRVEQLRPRAQDIANESGKEIEVVQFTNREHVETITPITPSQPPPKRRPPTIEDVLNAARKMATEYAEQRDPDAQFKVFDQPIAGQAPEDMEYASGVLVGTPVTPVPMVSITMLHGEDREQGKTYLIKAGTAEDLIELLRNALNLARSMNQ